MNPLRPRTPPPQPSPACGGGSRAQRRGRGWPGDLVAVLAGLGFALTLYVFYPGVMTYDALYVYKAIAEGRSATGSRR